MIPIASDPPITAVLASSCVGWDQEVPLLQRPVATLKTWR